MLGSERVNVSDEKSGGFHLLALAKFVSLSTSLGAVAAAADKPCLFDVVARRQRSVERCLAINIDLLCSSN